MADLNQLVQEALAGIIGSGGLPTEEALYQRQAQSEMENLAGRGLGISSVSRDALAKARTDAALAAQGAQLSALGQAASVAQQELNRGQQANQFGQSIGLQKKALGQQRDIANQNLLATGLGLGVGGLAQVAGKSFGPEISGGLRRMFGLMPLDAKNTELTGAAQQILSTPGTIDTSGAMGTAADLGGGFGNFDASFGAMGLPDLSGLSADIGGGFGNFDASFGDLGIDLSGLMGDLVVPQFEWGNYL